MTIEQEIERLRCISSVGLALIAFSRAISPGDFRLESGAWIYRPNNFVTFRIHFQRVNNITLQLRGRPIEFANEFAKDASLPLRRGRGGYSVCKIERPDQLDAAAFYIRHALKLYHLGPSRLH
jgi:hypothetical protein